MKKIFFFFSHLAFNLHFIVAHLLPQNSCWCGRFSMLSKGLLDLAQALETFLLVSY